MIYNTLSLPVYRRLDYSTFRKPPNPPSLASAPARKPLAEVVFSGIVDLIDGVREG
jgi:hypothetical protein